jgi:hypothetical protein
MTIQQKLDALLPKPKAYPWSGSHEEAVSCLIYDRARLALYQEAVAAYLAAVDCWVAEGTDVEPEDRAGIERSKRNALEEAESNLRLVHERLKEGL